MKRFTLILSLVLWAVFAAKVKGADTNVLVIGSSHSFSEGGEANVVHEKPFNSSMIATQLQSILANDPAISGTVNVVVEDIYKTKTLSVQTSKDGFNTINFRCYSLAQHYIWPEGRSTRLANLRGEDGTAWDYVVIMADPYIIANFPGMYVEGADMLVKEIRKGTAEPILMAQWPENSSTFTTARFNEVVYRVGDSTGVSVVPAGLAWSSLTPQDLHASHPTPDGAYLAAASIYSKIFDRNAKTSGHSYNDAIADHAMNTIETNAGVDEYSSFYTPINVFSMKYVKKRVIEFRETGSSTEDHIKAAFSRIDERYGVSFLSGPIGAPVWDFNYGRGNDRWEDSKDYNVDPSKYKRAYGFPMHYYGISNAINNMPYGIDKQYFGSTYEDGTDLGIAYNMVRPGTREIGLPEEADVRSIPIRLMFNKMNELAPGMNPLNDGTHMNYNLDNASAAFMYTLLSGRCPLYDEPSPQGLASTEWMRWLGTKVGYETAWRMGHITTRAPGFQVLPASTDTAVTPISAQTISVRLWSPPTSNVTVNISSDDLLIGKATPSTITFTPENYNTPQIVTVIGETGPAITDEEFNVLFTSSSDDQAFDNLSDSWNFFNTRFDGGFNTPPVASSGSVTTNEDMAVLIGLAASDADGDLLSYTIVSGPSHGTLTGSGATRTYSPAAGYFGADSFTFKANDGQADSNSATVTITVNEVVAPNNAPVANAGADQTLSLVENPGAGQLAAGVDIYLNAGLDSDNGVNSTWEDTLGVWNLSIDTGVSYLADAGSNLPGITAAYDFPGGITGSGGADGLGLKDLGVNTQPITLELWFKPDASASYSTNGQVLFETGGGTGFGIFYNNGTVVVSHDSNAGAISTDVSALTAEFIQVAVTYDTTSSIDNFKLYINGQLKETSSRNDNNISGGDDAGLGNRGLKNTGGAGSGDAGTESFDGKIAIFRGYTNQILTAEEVLNNFNSVAEGSPSLSAKVSLNGTVSDLDEDPVNTTWSVVSGPAGASFSGASALDSTVSFSSAGVYTLRLTADDGTDQSTDDVVITVNSATNHSVTYNGNGSDGGSVPSDAKAYNADELVTVLGNIGVLSKTGYNFAGWNTAADGSGIDYAAAGTFSITENVTLYAKWTAIAVYTLTVNGGSGGGAYTQGSEVPVTAIVPANYHFVNWSVDTASVIDVNSQSTTVVMPASAVTLTANVAIDSYNVDFNVGTNGIHSGGGALVQIINHGSGATAPVITANNGYTFTGWDVSFDNVTSNLNVTAQYFEIGADNISTVSLISATDRVAWFSFDADSSDFDENLSMNLFGGAVITKIDSKVGSGALHIDSAGELASISNNNLLNSGGPWSARSVAVWFKLDGVSGRQMIFDEGGSSRGFNIYVDNGTLYVGGWDVKKDGSDVDTWSGTWHNLGNVNAGQWYHVTTVLDAIDDPTHLDAAGFRAYLDGALVAIGNGMQMSTHASAVLGALSGKTRYHDGATSGSADFAGTIDDLAIWNSVLSAAEIAALAGQVQNIDDLYYASYKVTTEASSYLVFYYLSSKESLLLEGDIVKVYSIEVLSSSEIEQELCVIFSDEIIISIE